jgi:hypothetical protein
MTIYNEHLSESWTTALCKEPGVKSAHIVFSDDPANFYDPAIRAMIETSRYTGSESIIIETPDENYIVTVGCYDELRAVVVAEPSADAPYLARCMQLYLFYPIPHEPCEAFLPAPAVQALLARWELQIGMLFGHRYATELISCACGDKCLVKMSKGDLEALRLSISAVLGGCIDLEES